VGGILRSALADFSAMHPIESFRHCPRCGRPTPGDPGRNPFHCDACGFRYFFNPAVATAVFIHRRDGMVLLIRRAKNPALGKLAPPGGFIDFGETAEQAAAREVREEVGLSLTSLAFLCSAPNCYTYSGLTYPVLDLFFCATADDDPVRIDRDEVSSLGWYPPRSVNPEDLAFPSMQIAWQEYLER
jgi:ADP-ribose pyrophosphatase YjhB (NUDIX family)